MRCSPSQVASESWKRVRRLHRLVWVTLDKVYMSLGGEVSSQASGSKKTNNQEAPGNYVSYVHLFCLPAMGFLHFL